MHDFAREVGGGGFLSRAFPRKKNSSKSYLMLKISVVLFTVKNYLSVLLNMFKLTFNII